MKKREIKVAAYGGLAVLTAGVAFGGSDPAPTTVDLETVGASFRVLSEGTIGRGDVTLDSVEFDDGRRWNKFIHASKITEFDTQGSLPGGVKITTGPDTTGNAGPSSLEGMDGDSSSISDADHDLFADRILAAYKDDNLNHFFDTNSKAGSFSYVVEFEKEVRDNDSGPDNVGEILWFERGGNGSNSWIVFEAVDELGRVVGNTVLVSPQHDAHTEPRAYGATLRDDLSYKSYQAMTAVAVDVSSLGVSSFKRLRVRSAMNGYDGFSTSMMQSGQDVNADFKLMVIQTYDISMPAWALGD